MNMFVIVSFVSWMCANSIFKIVESNFQKGLSLKNLCGFLNMMEASLNELGD